MFYKGTLWVCAAFTAVLIGNTCWLQAGRCLTLMNSEWNKNAPFDYRFGIFLLSAATMSRFCFGIAGTWGNLLDTLLWEEGCGGSSGIQPIRACFWQLVCTTTSKSWTASQHLVRMMVLVLTSCYGLMCPGGEKAENKTKNIGSFMTLMKQTSSQQWKKSFMSSKWLIESSRYDNVSMSVHWLKDAGRWGRSSPTPEQDIFDWKGSLFPLPFSMLNECVFVHTLVYMHLFPDQSCRSV